MLWNSLISIPIATSNESFRLHKRLKACYCLQPLFNGFCFGKKHITDDAGAPGGPLIFPQVISSARARRDFFACCFLVHSTWATTRWWKITTRSAAGSVSRKQGSHREVESEGSRMPKKNWQVDTWTDEQKSHSRPYRDGRVCWTTQSPMLPESRAVNVTDSQQQGILAS